MVDALNNEASAVTWSACGTIACATLAVPLDHAQPTGGTVSLRVFGHASASGRAEDVLVLVGDRDTGMSARDLVREAPLTFGGDILRYSVISLAVRGSAEAPVPADDALHTGTLDVVDDLEILVRSLGVPRVRVIGWGNGATIAAAWVMTHPESVSAAVLDTPADPSASFLRQGIARIGALARGAEATMRWCASHLSCPFNQETRMRWTEILDGVDAGNGSAGLTRDAVDQAGYASMMSGNPSELFLAVDEARRDQPSKLNALGASVPSPTDGSWTCADHRLSALRQIEREWAQTKWRWFEPGAFGDAYARCISLGDAPRPLGALEPVAAAVGARVFVTLARSDPTASVDAPFAMAKTMKWTYRSVRMARHLVVGHDRFITARALDFLRG